MKPFFQPFRTTSLNITHKHLALLWTAALVCLPSMLLSAQSSKKNPLSEQKQIRQSSNDLLIVNASIANVQSGTNDQPTLTTEDAILISDGKIQQLGESSELIRLKTESTEVFDAKGRLVVPGFIESHGHLLGTGESLRKLNLADARSWEEIVQLVKQAAKKKSPGEWIVGQGWHQSLWNRKAVPEFDGYPSHEKLSIVSPDNPVLLTHRSGHMVLANQKAMVAAGVSRNTPDPSGGEILKNEKNEPIGVFRETAQGMIYDAYAKSRADMTTAEFAIEFREDLLRAQNECLRLGVTTFCDAGVSSYSAQQFKQAADRGKLKLRVWLMLRESNQQLERSIPKLKELNRYAGDFLHVGGIKQMLDGALGAHGAWLLKPYHDLSGSHGLIVTPLKTIRQTAKIAFDHRLQLCVHAIGDRANRHMLNLFEDYYQKAGDRKLRWRIEHAQHIHPDDIKRFGELGVIASMQGIHCTSDGPFVPDRLGPERSREGAYAWRSLLDHKAVIANGSDTPVETVNPLIGFQATISRRMKNGTRFFPEQSMTRLEALRSYTLDAAYAIFREKSRGSIETGKQADLVVLSKNILRIPEKEIAETRVDLTIVDGRIVFRAK